MISLFKVNERVGDSFRPVKGPKRANGRISWLKKVEKFLFSGEGWGTQQSFVRRGIAKNNKNNNVSSTFSQAWNASVSPFEPFYPRV